MLFLANVLIGLSQALSMLLWLIMVMVGIRVLISWVNPDPGNPIVRVLAGATDPFLRPLRRFVPAVGGVDFTPILFFMVLAFLDYALVQNLADYAMKLRQIALR